MEKFDKIFQTTACLSEETMKAYLSDELSAKDKHTVERHTADCPMCADALEGLSYLENPDKLGAYIERINADIDARIRPKRKTPVYRIKPAYSVAAALILLFGIAYILKISLFDFKQDSSVAEQMTEHTEKVQDPLEESLPVIEEAKEESVEQTSKTEADNDDVSEEIHFTEDFEIIESDEVLTTEDKTMPETVIEPVIAAEEPEDVKEEAEVSSPNIKDIQANLKKQAETADTDELNDEEQTAFFGQTRSSTEGSADSAERTEKKLFSRRNSNTAAIEKNYEKAVELYRSGKLEQAAGMLDRIITNAGLHQFDALWYRALIYKAKDEPDKAAELFQKVADSKTKFSRQAAKELDQE
jgi:hypothetical protein